MVKTKRNGLPEVRKLYRIHTCASIQSSRVERFSMLGVCRECPCDSYVPGKGRRASPQTTPYQQRIVETEIDIGGFKFTSMYKNP